MHSVDDYLGRTVAFDAAVLTIIGWDPRKGWRVTGVSFLPTWIAFDLWDALLTHGIFVWS